MLDVEFLKMLMASSPSLAVLVFIAVKQQQLVAVLTAALIDYVRADQAGNIAAQQKHSSGAPRT